MLPTQLLACLTPREQEVVRLVLQGLGNKACAEQLGCSQRTIEAHRSNIFKKVGVRNAIELSAKCWQQRSAQP